MMHENKRSPLIIYIDREGQLGNHLIIFSHLIAFARKHHCRLLNLGMTRFAEHFNGTKNSLVFCTYPMTSKNIPQWIGPRLVWLCRRYFSRILIVVFKKLYHGRFIPRSWVIDFCDDRSKVSENLAKLKASVSQRRFIFLMGWSFRDVESVAESTDVIKDYFKNKNQHFNNVCELETSLRNDRDSLIGIHLRRGDYKYWAGGRYFYPLEIYADIIRFIQQQLIAKKPVFIVISDSPEDANTLKEMCSELSVVAHSGYFIEDMLLLSRCDYIVGPPSTFSKWASFIGDTPIRFLDRRDTDCSINLFQLSSDLIPPHE